MWEELHHKRRCGYGSYGNSSRFVLMPLHCFRFSRRVDREMIYNLRIDFDGWAVVDKLLSQWIGLRLNHQISQSREPFFGCNGHLSQL